MTQSHAETETTAEQPAELSPYDTGARCEPRVWLPYGTEVTPTTPAENFGKVDFDDDEGSTVCVVLVERGKDGVHTVRVDPLCADEGSASSCVYET